MLPCFLHDDHVPFTDASQAGFRMGRERREANMHAYLEQWTQQWEAQQMEQEFHGGHHEATDGAKTGRK